MVGLTLLPEAGTRLIMIAGKGGVGKTTCAAAIAYHMAAIGKKTLIISSDPAPSLSDIFEVPLNEGEKTINGIPNLYGVEICTDVVLQKWKEHFGKEMFEVISSFFPMEYEIIDYIAGAPGIEEEYMLYYILEVMATDRYDVLVWDTAPAGHTLRLIQLPLLFSRHLQATAKLYVSLYSYFKKLQHALGLKRKKRSPLDIINGWRALAEETIALLQDASQVAIVMVTIPEALGVCLTQRVINEFDANKLNTGYMIINNVITVSDSRFLQQRKQMQQQHINQLEEQYQSRIKLHQLPLAPFEIKGVDKIAAVAKFLFSTTPASSPRWE